MIITREWEMADRWTFKMKTVNRLIRKYLTNEGKNWIDPFAGETSPCEITNDLNPERPTKYHLHAFDFINQLDGKYDGCLFDPPYCYDSETEVLTDNGWKYFYNLTKDDLVATLNTKTNYLEYQKPTEIIASKYKGKMVYINSVKLNLLVTPNHRMWMRHNYVSDYRFVTAKSLNKYRHIHFQRTLKWKGEYRKYFVLPSVKLVRHNIYNENFKPDKKIPMNTWLKFLGLFLSEGSAHNLRTGRKGHEYIVSISQYKEDGRKTVKKVLKELGIHYLTEPKTFKIYNKQLWTYLRQFGKTKEKFIPKEIKALSAKQLQILLDYLLIGDGCVITSKTLNQTVNKYYNITRRMYFTSSEQLMSDVCEIAIKCGYSVSARKKYDGVYTIYLSKSREFRIDTTKHLSEIDYNGMVYCVSVPNKTLIVKRRNKTCVSGNSLTQVKECYEGVGIELMSQQDAQHFPGYIKDAIAPKIKTAGIVMCFGWDSTGMGKNRGFEMMEIKLINQGGHHHDLIVTVERKFQGELF